MTVEPLPQKSSKRWTVAVIALTLLLGWLLLALLANSNVEASSETFENIKVIQFDVDNGPVGVTGGRDVVRVDVSTTVGLLGGRVRFEVNGDTLRVVQNCPWFIGWSCRASFEITAPPDVEIIGHTSNGRVDLQHLTGLVDLRTSNGNVTVAGLSGPLHLRTSNGAIVANGLSSPTVDMATSNGRIVMAFTTAPETVAARTSNGGIEVGLPRDAPPFAVTATTSNGQVQTAIRTDPAASHTLDLRTSNGDIVIGYPD